MKMKKIMVAVAALTIMSLSATTALAATPKYQYNFDGDLGGVKVMTRAGDNEDGGNPGTMPEVNNSVKASFDTGVNGKAVYLDGTYGLVLDAKAVGDTYSIAFWVNPSRFSNYGPIVQIGSDLLEAKNACKWLNITKTDWDGDSSPIIWSRNQTLDSWPWYLKAYFSAGGGYIIDRNTWTHITVTVDGSKPGMDPALGTEVPGTVHSQLFINGELIGEGPVAAEVFKGDSEVYIGINCWDIIFKGLFDDIKIYDTVLTAAEVTVAMNEPAVAVAVAEKADETPKTGVVSTALFLGLGAAVLGAGAFAFKKKEIE